MRSGLVIEAKLRDRCAVCCPWNPPGHAFLLRFTSSVIQLRWLLLLGFAVLTLTALGLRTVASQSGPVLGVDADPAGSSATVVGTIDSCRRVAAGETFQVDVTVQQVNNLAGFEAALLYDPSVLKVTDVDYELFLATAGDVLAVGETPPDADGSLSLSAALFPLPDVGTSGDGVLARVTFEAVGEGECGLDLSAVKLADINLQPIGDTSGDDFFDGLVSRGQIHVNQPCPSSTPTATPTSTATPVVTTAATPVPPSIEAPPSAGTGTVGGGPARPPPWLSLSLVLASSAFLAAAVVVARR